MNSIEREFCDTLSLLSDFADCSYIVAFSGGVDSLALLALTVKAVGRERVFPVYVNHNIRSESELKAEIELNKNNCNALGVNLKVRTIEKGVIKNLSKGVGTEACARKIRYSILEEERISAKCKYILTAHHQDDQIETVLMKILSKSPVPSLRGIAEKTGNYIRPLLEFSKKQLKEYVSDLGFVYSTDSTNSDNSIKRNEIRNSILPELVKVMPDCGKRILNLRDKAYDMCIGSENYYDSISMNEFKTLNEAKKTMALFDMWDNVMGTVMPQTLAKRVFEFEKFSEPKKASSNGGEFYSYNGMIYLINLKETELYKSFELEFNENTQKFILPNNMVIERKLEGSSTDIVINPSVFKGRVVIRFAREGEVIKLKDGSKTVNKLLQGMKVPEVFRSRVPVIADEDGLCVVFGSVYGGKDRICVKLRSPLALGNYYKYICYKDNYAYE